MLVNGIDAILISVKDLDESVSFFRDRMGLELVSKVAASRAELTGLWGLDEGAAAKTACLKHPEQPTLVRLMEFAGHPGRYIREGQNVYDYGLFDVAFRTKDVDKAVAEFAALGLPLVSPAAVYSADWAKVTVKEAVQEAPDKVPLALIQRLTDVVPFEGDFSVMIDCAQFCLDYDATLSFYVDILGLTPAFNMELPAGLIAPVIQTPEGTKCRMAFLVKPGSPVPAVELIGTDAPAGFLERGEGIPGYGIFALALEVEDLAATLKKVSAAGYKILSGPLELGQVGMPSRESALVEGPNRVALEFFEKS